MNIKEKNNNRMRYITVCNSPIYIHRVAEGICVTFEADAPASEGEFFTLREFAEVIREGRDTEHGYRINW